MSVGLIVTLISTALPARKASRVAPAAALRDDPAGSPRKALRTRAMVGAGVLGLGMAVLLVGLYVSFESGPPEILYVGVGAAVIFMGVAILSPLIARPVVRIIGWPFARIFKIPGKLAQENAIRTPRRTSSTAAALMIGITFVTLAATMAASIRGTIDDILGNSVNADVMVSSTNRFDPTAGFTPDVAEIIAASPDVADLTRVQAGAVLVNGSETFLEGIEDDYTDYFPPDLSEGSLSPRSGEVVMESGIAESNGWVIGSTVELVFEASGAQEFELVGTATGDVWGDVIAISQDDWAANYGARSRMPRCSYERPTEFPLMPWPLRYRCS